MWVLLQIQGSRVWSQPGHLLSCYEKIIYGHSHHSRRIVVSYKRKYVHKVLVNCLFKLAQEKSVVRWTDHPAMTIAVDLGRKAIKQTNKPMQESMLLDLGSMGCLFQTWGIVLCPWARHFILCLVLVQPRKTRIAFRHDWKIVNWDVCINPNK